MGVTPPYRAVLLDIEGTTTPISFVFDVLFPYARQHLEAYLQEQWENPEVAACVAQFCDQSERDRAQGLEVPPIPRDGAANARRTAVLQNALQQMDGDRKVTCLKTLQGLIWRDGYRSGVLRGEVYPDVVAALHRWESAGIPACIYSSGSVGAQRLLFGHSTHGDLQSLLSGYFDTTTGPKRDAASYRRIADATGHPPAAWLFATDVPAEAEASQQAGMRPIILRRPGNPPLPPHPFPEAESFDSL